MLIPATAFYQSNLTKIYRLRFQVLLDADSLLRASASAPLKCSSISRKQAMAPLSRPAASLTCPAMIWSSDGMDWSSAGRYVPIGVFQHFLESVHLGLQSSFLQSDFRTAHPSYSGCVYT